MEGGGVVKQGKTIRAKLAGNCEKNNCVVSIELEFSYALHQQLLLVVVMLVLVVLVLVMMLQSLPL